MSEDVVSRADLDALASRLESELVRLSDDLETVEREAKRKRFALEQRLDDLEKRVGP